MRLWAAITISLILSYATAFGEEEYSFDFSEIEERALDLGGYLEFRPVLFGLDNNAALHKLKLYDRDKENTHEEYNFTALFDGSYRKGITEFHAIVNIDLTKSYLGWDEEQRFMKAICH